MTDAHLMRAARFVEPRRIEIAAVARPEPAPHEVRIAIEGCGVCGSNLVVWQGRPWLSYPLAPGEPGHEAWGRIDRVGGAVRGIRAGERCAFLTARGFAEYAVADPATLVPLPSATDIFPGEALGCALNIHRRAEVRAGDHVAVIGIGFLGALLVHLAVRSGARVIALSQREFSLALARRMGAAEAISCVDMALARKRVVELTGTRGCERVIEAAGTQQTLDLASALVATAGRLIIAGYHQDGPRQIDLQSWNWRGIDVINAHERAPERYVAGMRAAAAQIASGALDPAPLYTHGFSLDQSAAAFQLLETRPPGFIKAWISPARERIH
jgi:threonine dehydrogenase-like Zn-dependent dehydrogenase